MIWRIYEQPRINLFDKPTPLEKAVNLSREYGVEIFVKRDDVMNLAFGGNKARKLEFLLGEAIGQGCDTIITRGSYYSNHVRLTAAAARKLGLDIYIVTYPPHSGVEHIIQGNILLNKIFGAHVTEVGDPREADEKMIELSEELKSQGHKPYIIPAGGATPRGVLGYVLALYEIMDQMRRLGKKPRYIIHATGTGATQAGLILGVKLLGVRGVDIIGVNVEKPGEVGDIAEKIVKLSNAAAELLGITEEVVKPGEVDILNDYTFGGYGRYDKELIDFIKEVARKEALLLEPIYTGKAFYALIDLIERKIIREGDTVVFIHTGGTPLIFQLAKHYVKE